MLKALLSLVAILMAGNSLANSRIDFYKDIAKRIIAIPVESNTSGSVAPTCVELFERQDELNQRLPGLKAELASIREEIEEYTNSNPISKFFNKNDYRSNLFAGHAANVIVKRSERELEAITGNISNQCACYDEVMEYFQNLRGGSYYGHSLVSRGTLLAGDEREYQLTTVSYDQDVLLYEASSEAYGALGIDAIAVDSDSCEIVRNDLVYLRH